MPLGPKQLAELDAAYWAVLNCIKLQKGVWSFDERPYLVEPMQMPRLHRQGEAPAKVCYMKGTQLGFTELNVLIALWGLIMKVYERGVLYLFPTISDVRDFGKMRFAPLIEANPTAIGQHLKDAAAKTDSAQLKKVGEAFLMLRGGSLSKQLEVGAKESSGLRGVSADRIVYDELDIMDSDVILKAEGRMGDSTVYESAYISNPVIPGSGISAVFDRSDQRHWFRRCGCGSWTCAELTFPECVAVSGKTGKGYIQCRKCGREVNIRGPGQWVAAQRQFSDTMWGYQLSQLSSPTRDPWEILQEYNNPPDDNLADVVRLKLGTPYQGAADGLKVAEVLALCGYTPQAHGHEGPCAMGVDHKPTVKHVVIGLRSGRERYTILRVARVATWDEVMQMALRFHVRSAVVDAGPDHDSGRTFQKDARCKTYLCQYSDSTPVGTMYNDNTGLVKVNRNEICDATRRLVTDEKRLLELPAVCEEIKEFAAECASLVKVETMDKKTHTPVYRYRRSNTVPDDYRHALNYFYLAASGGKVAVCDPEGRQRRAGHVVNEYARV
jgi:hypothetical protein